jgi:hypothetical protein
MKPVAERLFDQINQLPTLRRARVGEVEPVVVTSIDLRSRPAAAHARTTRYEDHRKSGRGSCLLAEGQIHEGRGVIRAGRDRSFRVSDGQCVDGSRDRPYRGRIRCNNGRQGATLQGPLRHRRPQPPGARWNERIGWSDGAAAAAARYQGRSHQPGEKTSRSACHARRVRLYGSQPAPRGARLAHRTSRKRPYGQRQQTTRLQYRRRTTRYCTRDMGSASS